MQASLRLALVAAIAAFGCGSQESSTPQVASAPAPQPETELRETDLSPSQLRLLEVQKERRQWLEENRDRLAAARRAAPDQEAQLLEQLDDPDPEVRADAAYYIDLSGPGARERVIALARQDQDPQVRVAAAEALGDDDSYLAVVTLLQVLEDPDPAVVVAALEALEDTGDESVIVQIQPLTSHPDPSVAEAAQSAIEYLE